MSESNSSGNNRVRTLFESPYEKDSLPRAGKLGLLIFLASLSMLFAASMVGYLVVRFQAQEWPPEGMPSLPSGLWLSTLLILISSGAMHFAIKSIRRNQQSLLCRYITFTLILGLGFLLAQWWNWWGLIARDIGPAAKNLYAFTFYMLTGLHAIHVLGGIICLIVVTLKSYFWSYTAQDHDGVEYCAIYWHFLDGVWLIIYFVLLLAG